MPSRVRAHYVKLLLDWTVSALTKSSPKASLDADSQDFLQILSRKWGLLFVLLTSVNSPAQSAPNVTLAAAAAATCKGCRWQQASSEEGVKLALALQQTVLALNTKFKHSFRPSLEHSIVLLESSLAHVISCRDMAPPPGSLPAWEGLATQACIQLLEVCTSHPNQKKVFTAVVTKHLLLLLSQAVWQTKSVSLPSRQLDTAQLGSTAIPTATTGRQTADQLAAVTKQLLKSVVFHSSSIEGLIELGNSFSSSSHGAHAVLASEMGSTPRSYHSQLLQVVKNVLTDTSDAAAPAAFMHFMSWLASQFAHLVKSTCQASLGEPSQVHQQELQSSLSATAAVPLSADFYFFATLLQPLLSHLQNLDAYKNSTGAGADLQMEGTGLHTGAGGSHTAASKSGKQFKGNKKEVKKTNGVPVAWHIAAEGAALLMGAMQAGNVYRPTEDTHGRHRLLLADLADTVLQHAKIIMQGSPPGSSEHRQCELVAVCGVLSAILAVEHRAVQPHLAHIWHLLWLAAQERDGLAVARAVAAGLVGAYAELRQLQFLLQSMLEALLSQHPATAAAVICTLSFVSALARAVREMPSGQAAPMITFTAEHLPSLATLPVGSPTQAAFAEVLTTCLANIRVEVVSAPTLADAVAELLQNSLAPALLPAVGDLSPNASGTCVCKQQPHEPVMAKGLREPDSAPQYAQQESPANLNGVPQHAGSPANLNLGPPHAQHDTEAVDGQHGILQRVPEQLLGCLLRLYSNAVNLYGQCAATQMQITPLPGQGTGLSTQQSPAAEQTGTNNAYFSALSPASQPNATLPSLPIFWEQASTAFPDSSGTVIAQLTSCALQRILTLHEQLLHEQYTCPLIQAQASDHPDQGPAPASDSVQTDGQNSLHQGVVNLDESQLPARLGNVLNNDLDSSEQIQLELQQLSDLVLHSATMSLAIDTKTDIDGGQQHRLGSTRHSMHDLQTAFWRQPVDRLELLAQHASEPSLQNFVAQLLHSSICLPSYQSQASSSHHTGADSSAAAAADTTAVTAALFTHHTFLEQFRVQQAWLHAVQAQVARCFQESPACLVGTVADSLLSQQADSYSKRRKPTTSGVTYPPQSKAHPPAHTQLAETLPQAVKPLQDFLSSHGGVSQSQPGATASVSGQLSSGSKHSKGSSQAASRKRKASKTAPSNADWISTHLGTLTALLRHTASAHLSLLAPESACALANLMLQAQLWLAQHCMSTTSPPPSTPLSMPTSPAAAPASTNAQEQAQAQTPSQAVAGLSEALMCSQKVVVKCLQAAPDVVAAALLQAGPSLWQWLPLTSQLTTCLAGGLPGGNSLSVPQLVGMLPVPGQQQSPVGLPPRAGHSVGEDMLVSTAACVQKLAGHCLGVRQPTAASNCGEAVVAAEDDFGGFQAFVHWLSKQLQESPHSSLPQQTGISRIDVSSQGGITQRGMLLVIAEAVLAAVAQAEAGAASTKRKKAAAEVITGPVLTAQNQVKFQQLQSIASALEATMRGIMPCQISQVQSPPPVPGSQTPVRARTAAAESVEAAAEGTLQDMDGTAVGALFGCVGHLLRFQSKTLPKAALTESGLNHAGSAQQVQQPARQAESAEGDGGRHNSIIDAACDTMVASDLPWVLSSLTQQVARLTDVLQLPWQLMPGKGVGLSGRLELTLNNAHHVFGYLQAVASTLPKLDAHIGQTLWLPLLTLHIHALATLSPILQAPLPLRHAGSAPMGVPTLVAPADPKLKPFTALRRTLLLALRDLLKNSNREQQQQLCPELTQALAAAQSSTQALPYLEALLVALETPRSPRGLHLLARHSQDVVSALLLFITATANISAPSASAMISADSSCNTPQQPVICSSNDQRMSHDHQNGSQSAAAAASLQSNVSALNTLQSSLFGYVWDKASLTPLEMLKLPPPSNWWSAQEKSSRALQGQPSSEDSLYSAAAVATAHRCLESVLARESVFILPPSQVAQALFSPAVIFAAALANSSGRAVWGLTEGAGVFVGCCSLVMAGLRHRAGTVRRCMALVGASTRALLKMLMHWYQVTLRELSREGLLVVCASELAQLYTTIGADKAGLGKYCVHLLADYITSAAAPPLHATSSQSAAKPMAVMQQADAMEALAGPAATALRQGAFALYGACSPAEVQHIHANLSGVWSGVQRVALADLRREYEANYRYTGKV
ncbi:hypothetical protein WJX77_011953 [Trebouxia sp. C0004]